MPRFGENRMKIHYEQDSIHFIQRSKICFLLDSMTLLSREGRDKKMLIRSILQNGSSTTPALLLKLIQLLNAQSEPFFTRMIKVSKLDNKAFWTHIWPLPTNRSGVTNKNIYMPRFGENLMKIQNSNQFERLSKQQSINLRITLTGRRFWRERQKCRLTFIASKKL